MQLPPTPPPPAPRPEGWRPSVQPPAYRDFRYFAAEYRETGAAGGCAGKMYNPNDPPKAKPKRASSRPAASTGVSGVTPASTGQTKAASSSRSYRPGDIVVNAEDIPKPRPGEHYTAPWIPTRYIDGLPVYGPHLQDTWPPVPPDPSNRGGYLIGSRPVPPRPVLPACKHCGRTSHRYWHCPTQLWEYKKYVRAHARSRASRTGYLAWLRSLHEEREANFAGARARRESRQRLAAEIAAEAAAVEVVHDGGSGEEAVDVEQQDAPESESEVDI